jgi:hypothetical protein
LLLPWRRRHRAQDEGFGPTAPVVVDSCFLEAPMGDMSPKPVNPVLAEVLKLERTEKDSVSWVKA